MRLFLTNYLQEGEIALLARRTGIHPNTVYTWTSDRNKPSVQMLVWFFRALSEHTGIPYEQIWIDYVYHLEGRANAHTESKRWIQGAEHQEQTDHEEESSETVESD